MKAKISEVFDSVQGEGIYVGEKQIFVRFFGCNLNCKFCDTKLEYYQEYEAEELLGLIKHYKDKYHSISFTGGEPLLQKEFLKEMLLLTRRAGFKNYLETNGTLADELAEVIDVLDVVAMDLKLPSSTGLKHFWEEHRKFLDIASSKESFLKTVICKSTQDEDISAIISLLKDFSKSVVLVLQPDANEDGQLLKEKIEKYRDMCMQENITACIIPQMHKIVGVI